MKLAILFLTAHMEFLGAVRMCGQEVNFFHLDGRGVEGLYVIPEHVIQHELTASMWTAAITQLLSTKVKQLPQVLLGLLGSSNLPFSRVTHGVVCTHGIDEAMAVL